MKKLIALTAATLFLQACASGTTVFHGLDKAAGYSQMANSQPSLKTNGRHDENHLPNYRAIRLGMTKASVRELLGDSPQWTNGFRASKWQYNTNYVTDAGADNVCQVELTFDKNVVSAFRFKNVASGVEGGTPDVCAEDKKQGIVVIERVIETTSLNILQ